MGLYIKLCVCLCNKMEIIINLYHGVITHTPSGDDTTLSLAGGGHLDDRERDC